MKLASAAFALLFFSCLSAASEPYPDGPFSAVLQYDGRIQATPMNAFEFSSFTQVVETRPGGALVTRKSPGVTTYEDLLVKVPTTDTLFDHSNVNLNSWYEDEDLAYKTKDAIIRIYDGERNTQAMYLFYRVFPASRKISSKGGITYATYNLTYNSFERDLET
ncbi:MAG: phage tail protein [Candidatus ainarchaeum sp.]|nr:phage tail protein [Candidatus ainarchaeum sp.]